MCDVDTTLKKLALPILIGSPFSVANTSITAPFDFGFNKERWMGSGLLGGDCFDLDVQGFSTPSAPVTVHDGCGDHLVTVGKPAFACQTPSFTFICFESKNVNGNNLPLPVGFDRPEDVCAVLS